MFRAGGKDILLCGGGGLKATGSGDDEDGGSLKAFVLPGGEPLAVEGWSNPGLWAVVKYDEPDVVFFIGGGQHGGWSAADAYGNRPSPAAVKFQLGDGKLVAKGRLGGEVSVEDGQKAARACAINLLAQIKAGLGDLDRVHRVVRLGGFINSAPGFPDGPQVMNGASDLMVAAFGDKGRHARTTVGVSALPLDAAVEVEGSFEVD